MSADLRRLMEEFAPSASPLVWPLAAPAVQADRRGTGPHRLRPRTRRPSGALGLAGRFWPIGSQSCV